MLVAFCDSRMASIIATSESRRFRDMALRGLLVTSCTSGMAVSRLAGKGRENEVPE